MVLKAQGTNLAAFALALLRRELFQALQAGQPFDSERNLRHSQLGRHRTSRKQAGRLKRMVASQSMVLLAIERNHVAYTNTDQMAIECMAMARLDQMESAACASKAFFGY